MLPDYLDDEITALSLQLEEMNHFEQTKKGKRRAGDVPDLEAAYSNHVLEMQSRLVYVKDVKLAHSIANAVNTDEQAIAALFEDERQVEEDRQFAIQLSSDDPDLEDPPPYTNQAQHEYMDDDIVCHMGGLVMGENRIFEDDEVRAGPSVPYAQRQAQALGNMSREMFECCACNEKCRVDAITQLECDDRYCGPCLTRVIMGPVKDHNLSYFPPRCHGTDIPFSIILKTLNDKDLGEFQNTEIEKDTVDKTYCSNPQCGRFIVPGNIEAGEATCPRCYTQTCHICKNAAHPLECPEDPDIQATLDLGDALHWKRCYSCRALVERDLGCNHMTCRCGAEFCYVCSARWVPRQCNCDLWEEENLIRRVEQLVDRDAPANVGPAERQRRIVELQDDLRDNEHCEHSGRKKFTRVDYGRPRRGFQCELCDARHWKYILRCKRCQLDVCEDCRRNRV